MTGGEKRAGSPGVELSLEGNGHHESVELKKAKLDHPDKATGEAEHDKGVNGNGNSEPVYVKQQDSVRTETSSEAVHGIDEKSAVELVEKIYGLKMPKDFADFWDFCCRTNPMNPRMALSALNLELVGPFDILAGDLVLDSSNLEELQKQALLHWRYYYDVPEVQTVLRSSGQSQVHYGYFRHSPSDLPAFVICSNPEKDSKLVPVGANLFAVVHKIATDAMIPAEEKEKSALKELLEVTKLHADKFGHSTGEVPHTRHHDPAVISQAPHGIGLLAGEHHEISFEKKHHLSHAGLDALLADFTDREHGKARKEEAEKKLADLEEQLAIDQKEGNHGTTLELGLALFCNGDRHFNKRASRLLTTAYKLQGKDKFAEIAESHLEHRHHGSQLGKFELKGN